MPGVQNGKLAEHSVQLPLNRAITLEEILHHTKAAARARPRAMVVADMPYLTYEVSPMDAARNAGRLLKEGSSDAVKVRGGQAILRSIEEIVRAKVPVMGHLDYSLAAIGAGKDKLASRDRHEKINQEAKKLQETGCFALIVEGMPKDLVRSLARSMSIPVIGLKSGPFGDGQVIFTEELIVARLGPLIKKVMAEPSRN